MTRLVIQFLLQEGWINDHHHQEEDIRPQFQRLQQTANTAPLRHFTDYVSSTWIESNTWPPSSWSVFMQSVRTNNDVEGWQLGLHTRAQGKSQLPMYLLIDLLYKEAKLTSLNVHMVSEKKLRRVQRRRYRQIQAKVFSLWDNMKRATRRRDNFSRFVHYLLGREAFKTIR